MDLVKKIENFYLNENQFADNDLSNFNKIFSFDNIEIDIIGTSDKPYFKIKNILTILGHAQDENSLKSFIEDNIPEKYKILIKDTSDESILFISDYENLYSNEEIYISELGLYNLLSKSNKNNAEQFQDYIYSILKEIRMQISYKRVSDIKMLIEENKKILKSFNEEISYLDTINEKISKTEEKLTETRKKLNKLEQYYLNLEKDYLKLK